MELILRLLEPWRRLASPVFQGIDEIPADRPLLFVGNHTLYGVFDIPLMFAELYVRRGIFLRSLGDHLHFKVPLWGDLLQRFGAVDGTRENCARLMEAGESILVYPGGGREVAKRKGEQYKLVWKERLGFARMAIAHACTIVPFAAVGVEHAYDIILDADEIMASPVGRLLRKLGVRSDVVMPIATGIGPTPLPRPERLYFHFGPAIRTAGYGRDPNEEACRALRDQVKAEVEAGIAALLELRERDPGRSLLARLLARPEPWPGTSSKTR
jgi:1-acyl-sn-glycerol-3-phosphate acyltransferase